MEMDIKTAKEVLRAGAAWANWTAEQMAAMKVAYDAMTMVEEFEKEKKQAYRDGYKQGTYDTKMNQLNKENTEKQ